MMGLVHADRLPSGAISMAFTSERHYDDAVELQKKIEQLVGPIEPVFAAMTSEGMSLGGILGGEVTLHLPQHDTDQEE